MRSAITMIMVQATGVVMSVKKCHTGIWYKLVGRDAEYHKKIAY
jgi:hypothetical protein